MSLIHIYIGVQEKAEKDKLLDALMGKPVQKAVSYTHLDVYKRQVPFAVGDF